MRQVFANDAHQEDGNDIGQNDCVDSTCGPKPDVLAFQHALEDQVRECLGAERATRGDENLSKDRQKEDRLDQDHDCDCTRQMW